MKEILFDGKLMKSIKFTHETFRVQLGFSSRYRYNMDSLFDELLNLTEDVSVRIINYRDMEKNLGEYAGIYRSVFEDASKLNPHVVFAADD